MKTMDETLFKHGIEYSVLNRGEGFRIYNSWLEVFAKKVKDETGKFTLNKYVWEAYLSGLLSNVSGEKGLALYKEQAEEDFYLIYEQGKIVYDCKSANWPELGTTESIVFPKKGHWAMVFSHEGTMHYVEKET